MRIFILLIILGVLVTPKNDHLIYGEISLKSTLITFNGQFSTNIEGTEGLIDSLSISGNLSVKKIKRKVGIEELTKVQYFRIDSDTPVLVELHPLSLNEKGGIFRTIIFLEKEKKEEFFLIKKNSENKFCLYCLGSDGYKEVSNIEIILKGNVINTSKIRIEKYKIELNSN